VVAVPAWRPEHDPCEAVVAVEEVRDLFARPEWHARAACRGVGTAGFFSDDAAVLARTVAEFCSVCPVVAECSDAGRAERFGAWGGRTARDRRRAGV